MIRLIVIVLLLLSIPCNCVLAGDEAIVDSMRVERLAGLCELWGAIKCFHPYLAYKTIDWDSALIKTIPEVDEANTADQYKRAIKYLLSFLKDPNTYIIDSVYRRRPARITHQYDEQPYLITTGGGIDVIVATDYSRFVDDALKGLQLQELFYGVAQSPGVIIDIRRLDDGGERAARVFADVFLKAFSVFLRDDLTLSSSRRRIYVGYPPQIGIPDSPFYSAFEYRHGGTLKGTGSGIEEVPLVLIVNEGSYGLVDLLGGIQAAHRAAIVHEGYFDREAGIETCDIRLPDSITVRMRMNELVKVDGSEGIHPDLVIPYVTDTSLLDCPPIRIARKILAGDQTVPPAVGVELSPTAPKRLEQAYGDMIYPSREYRLLALFRFWNVLHYFQSGCSGSGDEWNGQLRFFIRAMDAARDSLDYNLNLARLAAKLDDSNFWVESPVLDDYFGMFYPPVATQYIENQTVITRAYGDNTTSGGSPEVGDVVLMIDGKTIEFHRGRIAAYLPQSNGRSTERNVDSLLLGGRKGSPILLTFRRANGDTTSVAMTRSIPHRPIQRNGEPSKKLDGGVGYMDMTRISPVEFDSLMDIHMKTSALIFDFRGDCQLAVDDVAARLIDDTLLYAEMLIPRRISPDFRRRSCISRPMYAVGRSGDRYNGTVAALIDASSSARAEKICMALVAAKKAVTIGSMTAGNIGEVTSTVLPGGITIRFTGAEYTCPNGHSVTESGINPLLFVEPTVTGVREGKDEALDAAIEYLTGTIDAEP